MAVLLKTLTPLRSGKKWKFEEKRHFDFKILRRGHLSIYTLQEFYKNRFQFVFRDFFSSEVTQHTCRLTQQWCKDKKETGAQVHVNWFDVGDFWQRRIRWGHQGGHGEHCGHSEANPSRRCSSVEPEWDPGDDNNEAWWDVDLDHVVAHWPDELDFTSKSGIVS